MVVSVSFFRVIIVSVLNVLPVLLKFFSVFCKQYWVFEAMCRYSRDLWLFILLAGDHQGTFGEVGDYHEVI